MATLKSLGGKTTWTKATFRKTKSGLKSQVKGHFTRHKRKKLTFPR
ncbi:MAG: hypothetical protein ACLPN2_11380 [Terriglobales bacterium]|jgi:hypothetical protein